MSDYINQTVWSAVGMGMLFGLILFVLGRVVSK